MTTNVAGLIFNRSERIRLPEGVAVLLEVQSKGEMTNGSNSSCRGGRYYIILLDEALELLIEIQNGKLITCCRLKTINWRSAVKDLNQEEDMKNWFMTDKRKNISIEGIKTEINTDYNNNISIVSSEIDVCGKCVSFSSLGWIEILPLASTVTNNTVLNPKEKCIIYFTHVKIDKSCPKWQQLKVGDEVSFHSVLPINVSTRKGIGQGPITFIFTLRSSISVISSLPMNLPPTSGFLSSQLINLRSIPNLLRNRCTLYSIWISRLWKALIHLCQEIIDYNVLEVAQLIEEWMGGFHYYTVDEDMEEYMTTVLPTSLEIHSYRNICEEFMRSNYYYDHLLAGRQHSVEQLQQCFPLVLSLKQIRRYLDQKQTAIVATWEGHSVEFISQTRMFEEYFDQGLTMTSCNRQANYPQFLCMRIVQCYKAHGIFYLIIDCPLSNSGDTVPSQDITRSETSLLSSTHSYRFHLILLQGENDFQGIYRVQSFYSQIQRLLGDGRSVLAVLNRPLITREWMKTSASLHSTDPVACFYCTVDNLLLYSPISASPIITREKKTTHNELHPSQHSSFSWKIDRDDKGMKVSAIPLVSESIARHLQLSQRVSSQSSSSTEGISTLPRKVYCSIHGVIVKKELLLQEYNNQSNWSSSSLPSSHHSQLSRKRSFPETFLSSTSLPSFSSSTSDPLFPSTNNQSIQSPTKQKYLFWIRDVMTADYIQVYITTPSSFTNDTFAIPNLLHVGMKVELLDCLQCVSAHGKRKKIYFIFQESRSRLRVFGKVPLKEQQYLDQQYYHNFDNPSEMLAFHLSNPFLPNSTTFTVSSEETGMPCWTLANVYNRVYEKTSNTMVASYPRNLFRITGSIVFIRKIEISLRCALCGQNIQFNDPNGTSSSTTGASNTSRGLTYPLSADSQYQVSYLTSASVMQGRVCPICRSSKSLSCAWQALLAVDDGTNECNLSVEGEMTKELIFGTGMMKYRMHRRDQNGMTYHRLMKEQFIDRIEREVREKGKVRYTPSDVSAGRTASFDRDDSDWWMLQEETQFLESCHDDPTRLTKQSHRCFNDIFPLDKKTQHRQIIPEVLERYSAMDIFYYYLQYYDYSLTHQFIVRIESLTSESSLGPTSSHHTMIGKERKIKVQMYNDYEKQRHYSQYQAVVTQSIPKLELRGYHFIPLTTKGDGFVPIRVSYIGNNGGNSREYSSTNNEEEMLFAYCHSLLSEL